MLTEEIKEEIKKKALQNNKEEICGLLIETQTGISVFHSRNRAANKSNYFIINPIDYIIASEYGKVVGCYHSHINENIYFSEFDKRNSENHKLTYILYSIKSDKFLEYIPTNRKNQYLDIKFEIGKNDCFSLVRNFYKNELNININDYPRKDGWFNQNSSIVYENFKKEGFKDVLDNDFDFKNLIKHDILGIGPNKKQIFHFMIYLGNNIILHHPRDKYSCVEKLINPEKRIKSVFRYENFV